MKKEDILKASRKENKNRDLAELDASFHAGNISGRVGATVCCILSLLSSLIAKMMLYSPWVIYFSIMGTHWLVRFIKLRHKSDLILGLMFSSLAVLALLGFIDRLIEVAV